MLLEGKKAVVTGGTRGIGFAIVETFLKNGASVALFGSRQETVDKALAKLKAENPDWDVIGIMMDDGSFPNYQNVLELIVADYGRTCRRYHFISRIPQRVAVRFVPFDDHHATICARSDEILKTRAGSGIAVFDSTQTTLEAHA